MTKTVHLIDTEFFDCGEEAFSYVAEAFKNGQLCHIKNNGAEFEVNLYEEIID